MHTAKNQTKFKEDYARLFISVRIQICIIRELKGPFLRSVNSYLRTQLQERYYRKGIYVSCK